MIDEMNLLSAMKDTAPMRAEAFDNARTTLRAAMAAAIDSWKLAYTDWRL